MTALAVRPPQPRRPNRRRPAHGADAPPDGGRVTLYGIPWEGYVAFLDAVGERPLRVNYDDGVMEIMTISSEHESAKKRVAGLVEDLAIELGVEAAPRGSTTFRSKRIRKGLEPDECYYIANEARIRAKKKIDLRRDPPPDLVIEIDISYHEVTGRRCTPRSACPNSGDTMAGIWRSSASMAGGGWASIAARHSLRCDRRTWSASSAWCRVGERCLCAARFDSGCVRPSPRLASGPEASGR